MKKNIIIIALLLGLSVGFTACVGGGSDSSIGGLKLSEGFK